MLNLNSTYKKQFNDISPSRRKENAHVLLPIITFLIQKNSRMQSFELLLNGL